MPLQAELLRLGCPSGQTTPPTRPPRTTRPVDTPRCRARSQARDLRPGPTTDPPATRASRAAPAYAARCPRMSLRHADVAPCTRTSLGACVCRPAPAYAARRRARRPASGHIARRPRTSDAAHVVRSLACRPGPAHGAGRPAWSSGAVHGVRRLRISLDARARCPAPGMSPDARACRPGPAHIARCLWTILLPPPRAGAPQGCVSSGRAGHLWMPRPPPTPPPDPRRATHRAPEPAQVVPGPGQGRGGVSRPACAVTRAAAPPPPCPGWSPRRRESAGTRRCAGGATHGRPRA